MYFIAKVIVSAALIVLITEVAKRSNVFAAVIASLPITSLLAFIWLYLETGDGLKVAALSWQIIGLVIPSLAFFVVLSLALEATVNFWLALVLAVAATGVCYGLTLYVLSFFR